MWDLTSCVYDISVREASMSFTLVRGPIGQGRGDMSQAQTDWSTAEVGALAGPRPAPSS